MSRIEVGGGAGGGGGSGTSSALSATKLAYFTATPNLEIAPGGGGYLSFVGGTLVEGEDYWGIPGSALPLGATTDTSYIHLPDSDCLYDLHYFVTGTADPADALKMVNLTYHGNSRDAMAWLPVQGSGAFQGTLHTTDQAFIGDDPFVRLAANGFDLTVAATVTSVQLLVTKR